MDGSGDVLAGVGDGAVEAVEQVTFVGEPVEHADRFEDAEVCRARTPLRSTVMPRPSSSLTISPRAWAPVASRT